MRTMMRRLLRGARRGLRPLGPSLDRLADRHAGASTAGLATLDQFGLSDRERIWYQPSDWWVLRSFMRRLQVGTDDVFLDYGAGKGRVLLAAARRPFGRVVGVEVSSELAAQARENLARNRHRLRCTDVRVDVADAAAWSPPDDVTVAFMFSPFTGSVFKAAFEELLESLDRRPRPLLLVYSHPFEHNFVLSTGRAEVIDVSPSDWPPLGLRGGQAIVTYRLRPATGPAPGSDREMLRRPRIRDPRWLGMTDSRVELDAAPLVSP